MLKLRVGRTIQSTRVVSEAIHSAIDLVLPINRLFQRGQI
jgi:divalent metal cation (Fe/Co/Zn/Cd) transporter